MRRAMTAVAAMMLSACAGCSAGASTPTGKPVLDEPTLRSLGVYWIIQGDENDNARVAVSYRSAGAVEWKKARDLFAVVRGDTTQAARQLPGQRARDAELNPPADCRIFAGSLLMLDPDTEYEILLKLIDPDGGSAEELLRGRTIAEPVAPKPLRTLHVVPGAGGGSGTEADPFKGFAAADAASQPGDLILVHKGVYNETLHVTECGERDKPILWRAASKGDVIIDGQDRLRFGVQAWLVHDVWFEGFTIKGVAVGISANDSRHVVIRRNHILPSMYGICFNGNQTGKVSNFWVSDNLIEGPCKWPRYKGIENPGGMYMSGRGHVVAYNRVHHFADGIDTYNSKVCAAIDIHNNDISECTDDGIEMDFSERNTRCFENRLTNVFQGISVQPIMGGPTYIFRNTLYNVGMEPFKIHHNGTPTAELNWAPSGAIFFHNTIVLQGVPWLVWSQGPVYNCVSRNNLFVGTSGEWAMEFTCKMVDCDFDYDGFAGMLKPGRIGDAPLYENLSAVPGGPSLRGASPVLPGPFGKFLRWNDVRYDTLADVKAHSPVERHALQLDSRKIFASDLLPPDDEKKAYANTTQDFRLKAVCGAIDAGEPLPGLNDGFKGKAPDLGAIESGGVPPHYGPRPE